MSTKLWLSAGLVLAVGIFTSAGMANAQTAPKLANHHAPMVIKGEFFGKAMCKTEKVEGKDVTTCQLMITDAKGRDARLLSDVKGRTLTATGPKASELLKLNGKDVIVNGTLSRDRKSIVVASAILRPAPDKHAMHTPAPTK